MNADGLWENRLGDKTSSGAFQLCHDVHQLRPDPFRPSRYSGREFAKYYHILQRPFGSVVNFYVSHMTLQMPLLHGPSQGLLIWLHCRIS